MSKSGGDLCFDVVSLLLKNKTIAQKLFFTFIFILDFSCPDSKEVTKKTIRIGARESVMYNTNPDGADK